jgi:hypothetical protein
MHWGTWHWGKFQAPAPPGTLQAHDGLRPLYTICPSNTATNPNLS